MEPQAIVLIKGGMCGPWEFEVNCEPQVRNRFSSLECTYAYIVFVKMVELPASSDNFGFTEIESHVIDTGPVFELFIVQYKRMSSANTTQQAEIEWDKSFIQILNCNGPRKLPCGTPEIMSTQEETPPQNRTRCLRPVRKDQTKCNNPPWTLKEVRAVSKQVGCDVALCHMPSTCRQRHLLWRDGMYLDDQEWRMLTSCVTQLLCLTQPCWWWLRGPKVFHLLFIAAAYIMRSRTLHSSDLRATGLQLDNNDLLFFFPTKHLTIDRCSAMR